MTGTEILQRTSAYEREISSIRLHAPQWKLLLAFDGQRTLAEVALSLDMPFAEALPLTETFLAKGWIEEQPITLDQYLKRSGAATPASAGTAIPPVVVLHAPKPDAAPAPLPPPPVPEKPVATPTIPVPPTPIVVTPQPLSVPEVVPVPVPTPVPAPAAPRPRGPMKLAAVVESIISTVGNHSLGQLLVYRVFLHISPELLMSEGITTIHLVNDPSLIKSEALQRAITTAVNQIVKRPLPENVYA